MEKGTRATTTADLEALAVVFGTSPASIVGGDPAASAERSPEDRRRLEEARRGMDAAAEHLGASHLALNEAGSRAAASVEAYYAAQRELAAALNAVDAGQIERFTSSIYTTLSHQAALGVLLEGDEP